MVTWLDGDPERLLYPESDGLPIADDTRQFAWIVKLQGSLDALFRHDPEVFVAADLFWYPVQGEPAVRAAPDTMVVFGRPKGHRHSYRQWREEGVAPQVVFEVQSPHDQPAAIDSKFEFYEQHGVEEYYHYDPQRAALSGWRRQQGRLQPILQMDGWVSPRLGIRFDLAGDELIVLRPDNTPFLTFLEMYKQYETALRQAGGARRQPEQERERANRLAAKLRALGVDPEA